MKSTFKISTGLIALLKEWNEAEKETDAAWLRLREFAAKNEHCAGTWRKLCHWESSGPIDKQLLLNKWLGIESPDELRRQSESSRESWFCIRAERAYNKYLREHPIRADKMKEYRRRYQAGLENFAYNNRHRTDWYEIPPSLKRRK